MIPEKCDLGIGLAALASYLLWLYSNIIVKYPPKPRYRCESLWHWRDEPYDFHSENEISRRFLFWFSTVKNARHRGPETTNVARGNSNCGILETRKCCASQLGDSRDANARTVNLCKKMHRLGIFSHRFDEVWSGQFWPDQIVHFFTDCLQNLAQCVPKKWLAQKW